MEIPSLPQLFTNFQQLMMREVADSMAKKGLNRRELLEFASLSGHLCELSKRRVKLRELVTNYHFYGIPLAELEERQPSRPLAGSWRTRFFVG